jgi:hypothetical protein
MGGNTREAAIPAVEMRTEGSLAVFLDREGHPILVVPQNRLIDATGVEVPSA